MNSPGNIACILHDKGLIDKIALIPNLIDGDILIQGSVGVIVGDIDDDDFVDGSGLVDDERVV